MASLNDAGTTYYASKSAAHAVTIGAGGATFPATGLPAAHVKELIVQNSYVCVVSNYLLKHKASTVASHLTPVAAAWISTRASTRRRT